MLVVVLNMMLLLVVWLLLGLALNVSPDILACASYCLTSMATTSFHIDV